MKALKITFSLIILLIISCNKENNDSAGSETIMEKPGILTAEVENIYSNYAMAYGNILRLGDYEILNHGFVLSKHNQPTIHDNIISFGPTTYTGRYGGKIENLDPNTDYYLCAFLEYEIDSFIYGNIKSFKTLAVNSWIERTAFQGSYLKAAVSFVIGDKLYVGTGIHDQYMNSFYEYNYKTDSWRKISRFPSDPRADAIAFTIGNYGYVGLGSTCYGEGVCIPYDHNDLWRYNPQDDTWRRMAYFQGTARANSTCFVIGDKAYVTGGSFVEDYDLWEYNASTNQWTKKTDYPGNCISRGISFTLNGKGYVGFGWSDGTCSDFWEYDPVSDIWTAKASFPGIPRYNASACTFMNKGLMIGGFFQDIETIQTIQYFKELWVYNYENNTWTELDTQYPGKGNNNMIIGVVNNRLFVGLGTDIILDGPYNRFDDFWEYIPELN